jgi:hypothetical protein
MVLVPVLDGVSALCFPESRRYRAVISAACLGGVLFLV